MSSGRGVGVSSGETLYLVSGETLYLALFLAAVATTISGFGLIKSVRGREPSFAWAFALVFVVTAFLVAVYFRRLL